MEAARAQGREMVAEAQAVRERVLRDLAVRRKKARQQVEKLNAGRERLLQAYDVVRRTIDEATDELSTSLSDARLAADAAARRIEDEPEPTLEELDEEVSTAGLVDLPIADVGRAPTTDGEAPGPFSGEVPAVGRRREPRRRTVEAAEATGRPRGAPRAQGPPPQGDLRGAPAGRVLQGGAARRRARASASSPSRAPSREPDGARARSRGAARPPRSRPTADARRGGRVRPACAARAGDDRRRPRTSAPRTRRPSARRRGAEAEADEPDADDGHAEADADAPTEDGRSRPPSRERDDALAPIDKELARRLKRALADEQNEVLDLLRRVKPKGVDDVLPAPDDARRPLVRGRLDRRSPTRRTAGAAWAGGTAGSIADLADELAQSLTAPLRERIDRSFAASDGNLDDVADRVRALYREWKGQRLAETSRHYLAAAYARGVYDALPAGAEVRWVVDPLGGPCPDCDDNVLGGRARQGQRVPHRPPVRARPPRLPVPGGRGGRLTDHR